MSLGKSVQTPPAGDFLQGRIWVLQMHYYQFHIGDYRAATAHLSNEEDLAYRRLLDMYYDMEGFLPGDTQWIARRIRVDNQTVLNVLLDMFEQTENGLWRHNRADKEIAKYKALEARNKANGSKGGRPKNPEKPSGLPVESHTKPTGKATNNHKPRTNNQIEAPEGVSAGVWNEFVAFRKSRKAPVTPLVIQGISEQARMAKWSLEDALKYCVIRGWQSFKADWVTGESSPSQKRDPLAGAI